jgi:5,10-methylene-tetrahydrofolate dehydrogenase/methenyl tetrahydrofolate cyclohydrolase
MAIINGKEVSAAVRARVSKETEELKAKGVTPALR